MSTILQNTSKRDHLIAIEHEIQVQWEESKVFESNPNDKPKYMATFPYPYMNGKLHLGHVFTISKADFTVAYKAMKGFNVLFPFGFHCTGMPIVAASGKLQRELNELGFEKLKDIVLNPHKYLESESSVNPEQKKKLELKQGNAKYQFEILYSMGIDLKEIPKFIDPYYWCTFFPPLATKDLKLFGCHVDWRRSFITTDANPHYDAFVRWQFNKLKALGKIKFGLRYTIWSPFDNQPCMDHDRSSGEGVGPLEYVGIKIKLVKPTFALSALLASHNSSKLPVYFIAATLRPETMYGQTNCFVGTALTYNAYLMDNQIYICTERSALNMSFQGHCEAGKPQSIFSVNGGDLIGSELKAPLSKYDTVYMLPLNNVLANKGTGIVTSVPSDSPDDYIMLMDIKRKLDYYKCKEEWLRDPVPIINTPISQLVAIDSCTKFKVKSPNDKDQLVKAKEMAYKLGFYSGVMLTGKYCNKTVSECKALVKQDLISDNLAFVYCEPESKIVSRSGDECVVNLCDQWYLDYGEEEWKLKTAKLLEQMECYHPETRHLFDSTLDWLNQWACARSFGLGTKLPWDTQFLVESLSDSTIYMAYYTICHLFKEYDIKANELTDSVFEFIFGDSDSSTVDPKFQCFRQQFEYYYPFDLRVSGKDLVPNHLTFCIYNHAALFPPRFWPKSIRSNGHLLLNSNKMSKSTGNFLTLNDCLLKYGSDATRFTLADAGDLVEDANFQESTANSVILRLFTQLEWTSNMLSITFTTGNSSNASKVIEKLFIQNVYYLCSRCDDSFNKLMFKNALKYGFYELQELRDWYMNSCNLLDLPVNSSTIHEFIRLQCLVMAPITSHLSEYIWRNLLKNPTSVINETFPNPEFSQSSVNEYMYIKSTIHDIRSQEATDIKRSKEARQGGTRVLYLYYTTEYPKWQIDGIDVLKETFKNGEFDNSESMLLGKRGFLKNKKMMPFVQQIKVI
eukprot:NODE_294_length_11497_cov_0.618530.p1 type:complete len:963 gc:universal NODE_294_length_11497_cov_0.618530:10273-7385(-)